MTAHHKLCSLNTQHWHIHCTLTKHLTEQTETTPHRETQESHHREHTLHTTTALAWHVYWNQEICTKFPCLQQKHKLQYQVLLPWPYRITSLWEVLVFYLHTCWIQVMNSRKQLFLVCGLWSHTTVKIKIVLHTITMTHMLFGSQITLNIEVVLLPNNHKHRSGLAPKWPYT